MLGQEAGIEGSRATMPAWDSLKHMQIVFALEDRFGIEFTEEQIPKLDSVRSIADHVQKHQFAANRG